MLNESRITRKGLARVAVQDKFCVGEEQRKNEKGRKRERREQEVGSNCWLLEGVGHA